MMTPLLFCVSRGYMEMVRMLMDCGADRTCTDRNVRFFFVAFLSNFFSLMRCSYEAWFLLIVSLHG